MMIGFGFLILLLVGGVVLALVLGDTGLLRRHDESHSPSGQRRPTARQILDERLARGEISREEYDEISARVER